MLSHLDVFHLSVFNNLKMKMVHSGKKPGRSYFRMYCSCIILIIYVMKLSNLGSSLGYGQIKLNFKSYINNLLKKRADLVKLKADMKP